MIAFIFDDRLPHDRKIQFQRMISLIKGKFDIEVLPSSFDENDLIEHLKQNDYSLVLLPWYKYLSWKKIDGHFGALRMERTSVAGYFADPILAFEFGQMPSFYRNLLLDFHRFESHDIDFMLQMLTHPDERNGFSILGMNTPVFHAQWMQKDARSTHCIDEILSLPVFSQTPWEARLSHFRFFLTGLWTLVMPEIKLHPQQFSGSQVAGVEIEIAEFQKRVAIKALFKNPNFTLKHTMEWMWPNTENAHPSFTEMQAHCDFMKLHHYPETQQIELTCFFLKDHPSRHFPNEVRGFWIEPRQVQTLKKHETHLKRVSVKSFLAHQNKKKAA